MTDQTRSPIGMERPSVDTRHDAPRERDEPAHRISLALQLPRYRLSVPVIRHLTQQALEEIGVTRDVAYDVQLALSEACANVLDHAGEGDSYEVCVTIGAERCELRITDTGRGFDHVSVGEEHAGPDDVRGRGLALIRAVMDRVDFASEPERGTLVTLTKRLEFDESSPGRILLARTIEQERREG